MATAATQNDALLWVRVGDAGEYCDFDSLDDALEYLNELQVGKVIGWQRYGFETPNYHGQDYISIFWGGSDTNPWADLDDEERDEVEAGLEENYL
jgi:hypothetical protein